MLASQMMKGRKEVRKVRQLHHGAIVSLSCIAQNPTVLGAALPFFDLC
jgi:hypothetical protein